MQLSLSSIFSTLSILNGRNNEELARIAQRLKAISYGDTPPTNDVFNIRSAVSFRSTAENYQTIYNRLQRAKGITSVAVKTGEEALDALGEMVRLANLYKTLQASGAGAEDLEATDTEFRAQASKVETLKASASYEGVLVFPSTDMALSVTIDPSGLSIDIAFDYSADIPDVSTMELPGPAGIDVTIDSLINLAGTGEVNKIYRYLGKAYSYDSQVSGYLGIAGAMINAANTGHAAVTDTTAVDLALATQIQLRQQISAALASQANITSASAAKIFGLDSQI